MRRALCLSALLALLPAATARADALAELERQQQRLFEELAPRVVFIGQKGTFGSGFFVDDQGLILTNAHVVGKDQATVQVVLHDGRSFEGQVLERGHDDLDTALVRIPLSPTSAVRLGGVEALRVGSWVASVGHGMGGIWTFSQGMVSNIYPAEADQPLIQTQIPLNPGNSGGPVFDREGRVVGLVVAGIVDSNAINFAIRSDVAVRSLEGLEGLCDCLVVRAPEGVPVFVNGAMAGKGPRVAVPAKPGTYEVFAVVKGQMRKRRVRYPEQRRIEL